MAAKKKKSSAKKPVAKKSSPKKSPAPKKKTAAKKKSAPKKKAAPKARVHSVVHWEIQAKDAGKIRTFYEDVFGWNIDSNNAMDYGMVSSQGLEGINGGIGTSTNGRSNVVVYASVPDIVGALARVDAAGGKTILPRTDMGMVVMAVFEDIEGNMFGLVED